MSNEDITKTTSYFNALRAVANAARKVEEVRVRYENTLDRLSHEKREADKELRAALQRAAELTGESIPISERDKRDLELEELSRQLSAKRLGDKGGKK